MTKNSRRADRTATGQSVHFLQRVCEALDLLPLELSRKTRIPIGEIMAMWKGSRTTIAALDQDELWVRVAEYVDSRIGALLAVREEMQRKLNAERTERQRQRDRTLAR